MNCFLVSIRKNRLTVRLFSFVVFFFPADPDAPHLRPPLPVFVQQAAAARMTGYVHMYHMTGMR